MNVQLRRFFILGAFLYVAFLSWFFYELKSNSKEVWRPSVMYNEVGDCPSTNTTAAPTADKVFDAKTVVPMKSVTARRKSFRARRSSSRSIMAMAKSSISRLSPFAFRSSSSAASSRYRLSSDGVMYTTSSAQFRSFGAEGLMYLPMPQYLKRSNHHMENTPQMMYPYMIVPMLPGAFPSSSAMPHERP